MLSTHSTQPSHVSPSLAGRHHATISVFARELQKSASEAGEVAETWRSTASAKRLG